MSEFFIKLFQNPSFLGALLGAMITGGLALYVNSFQHKKQYQQEINDSKKVLLIFHYYSKSMITSYNIINENFDKYDVVYNPYTEIETEVDDNGHEHLIYYPQDFQIKEYNYEIKPFVNKIKEECEFILGEFEKINLVNIYSLKIKSLDNILEFLSVFKSTIEPKLKNVINSEYPTITVQERDTINRIFEAFYNVTKI